MAPAFDVLVLGDYCLDLIFTGLDGPPELGREITASQFSMLPGGTYNTAACLHRLGVRTGWAGDFGDDEFSRLVIEQARHEGLDESLFIHHKQPLRNITVAASYPQDRAFIAFYDRPPSVPAGVKAMAKTSARAVFVAGLYSGPAFQAGLQLLRLKGMALIMDGNSDQGTLQDASVRKAIAACDLFLPNRREALRISAENSLEHALQRLSEVCPYVVVKDGAYGARAVKAGVVYEAPALDVSPVDTTGAGDAFNAGFIKAWLDGLPPQECLRWGNITGGLSTLAPGGTGRVVREADVRPLLTASA